MRNISSAYFEMQLFYLDRLKRPPVRWGVFPRINAWCKELISRVESLDVINTGDYGKFGVSLVVLVLCFLIPIFIIENRQ